MGDPTPPADHSDDKRPTEPGPVLGAGQIAARSPSGLTVDLSPWVGHGRVRSSGSWPGSLPLGYQSGARPRSVLHTTPWLTFCRGMAVSSIASRRECMLAVRHGRRPYPDVACRRAGIPARRTEPCLAHFTQVSQVSLPGPRPAHLRRPVSGSVSHRRGRSGRRCICVLGPLPLLGLGACIGLALGTAQLPHDPGNSVAQVSGSGGGETGLSAGRWPSTRSAAWASSPSMRPRAPLRELRASASACMAGPRRVPVPPVPRQRDPLDGQERRAHRMGVGLDDLIAANGVDDGMFSVADLDDARRANPTTGLPSQVPADRMDD